MIKRYQVRTYIDRLFCVKCDVEMCIILEKAKNYSYKRYQCPNCKEIETSEDIYPKLVYDV